MTGGQLLLLEKFGKKSEYLKTLVEDIKNWTPHQRYDVCVDVNKMVNKNIHSVHSWSVTQALLPLSTLPKMMIMLHFCTILLLSLALL